MSRVLQTNIHVAYTVPQISHSKDDVQMDGQEMVCIEDVPDNLALY